MANGKQFILDPLQRIATTLQSPPSPVPQVARAGNPPYEELLVRYAIGTGKFSPDKKSLSVKGHVFLLNKEPYGEWEGVYEFVVPLSGLEKTPPPAPPPFNRPAGPIPQPQPQAFSKGEWKFADGSSLTAIGPALLHTAQLSTLETDFWISSNQIITGGTGRFSGAQGLKTAGVSILLPPGVSLKDAGQVSVKSIDVYRVLRKEFIGSLPPIPQGS